MGISSDHDPSRLEALHVLQEQLTDIEGARAAHACGLLVKVLNDLAVKLQVDDALVLGDWPAGHFIFGGSSHPTPTKPVLMRYGLRVAAPSPHPEAIAAARSITCTAVTPANDWITDRRPTEADGDEDGNVVLRLVARVQWRPGSRFSQHVDWRHIGKGVPWKHTDIWQPPTIPAPEPTKPALAVGQRWRRRHGEVVTIQSDGINFRAGGWGYNPDGTALFLDDPWPELDLVELLPAPEPTPRKFASLSRTVTDFGHTIDAIDEDGVAWWMTLATDDSEPQWRQLLPLPGNEVAV